ncbi:nucleotide exchange factor GrpE [Bacillaceae bacterium IKA-2]|nr:nucleotide exchange factor GrpE [Bacillaceae bacterium IKA-2]
MDQTKQELKEERIEVEDELLVEEVEEELEEVILTEEQVKIEALETEMKELKDRLVRIQADYDNFRRRTKQEKEAAAKYKAQSLIEEIIPAVDNFDRALGVKAESEEAKAILQGMDMVYRQLADALKNEGLEIIESVGQSFDPHFHQAVTQVETDEFESNQVVEELQKGYKLRDRVLRPAMVKVNQ